MVYIYVKIIIMDMIVKYHNHNVQVVYVLMIYYMKEYVLIVQVMEYV